MSLLYSQVEEDLRAAVRQAVTGSPDVWRTLTVDIGCAGLAVPEERGGAGASWREVAVVAEELGRGVSRLASVPPVPFLGTTLATAALLAVEPTEVLAKVAAGGLTAVLVLPLSTPPGSLPPGSAPPSVRVDGGSLTGSITNVADAAAADVLLVPTAEGLYQVDAADARIVPVVALDQTRPLCDVAFDSAPATQLASGDAATVAWRAARTAGAVVLASEQLGVATWCLESTVDYVKTRYQFARPVGSFQAVKHRLAQLWVDVTQARAVARYAAGCLADADPDTPVAASLAQAHCGPVAVRAAEECVQLHGGIGFTWEHPAHWYLKRAKASAIALGTAAQHRAALGALVDLPA
jgi:alkylation response protein AidB-like acyl-CoA dehydrogenase